MYKIVYRHYGSKIMKFRKIMLATLLLLTVITIGAVSASEDIADDNVTAIEPAGGQAVQSVDEIKQTGEVIAQSVDDENVYCANGSEEILSDEGEFKPDVIWPHDSYFFDNTDGQGVTLTNTFSLEEKFHVGVNASGANGTFRVYYAGFNDFGPFKFNDTVISYGDIVDGIGVAELSIPRNGNPIYPIGYTMINYWIEYNTTRGNGNLSFWTNFIKNNINVSAKVDPLKFTDGENNNTVILKFSAPVEGQLQYYLDGIGNYYEHDINVETKSAEVPFEYLSVGTHDIRVFFIYDKAYDGNGIYSKTFTVTVKPWVPVITKLATKITSSKVTTSYNVAKKLVFTLKDENNHVIPGEKVTITFNGKTYNKVTNPKGQVSVDVSAGLAPKTYNAYIQFKGDASFKASSCSAKAVVSKANPKLTAKAKTFKKTVKIKKFAATLKTNLNKVMKNTKVTLKVNGKTYSATTNSKGQAIFKITKLTKKGGFTATIKYAGSKYYNAKTVKAKIVVK